MNLWGVPEVVTGKKHLLTEYNVRARRISATYARFYLEKEEGGKASKKGRFYWMALAAFAAKTVACSLEDVRVGSMPSGVDQVAKGLGKGNLWLFYDIAPWHWMHANAPDCMAQYENTRSDTNLVPALIAATQVMPWAAQALPKIGRLKTNQHIHAAFEKVRAIEAIPMGDEIQKKRRREAQLEHLFAIAEHEQKVVLQPLIYDDEDFAWWLRQQRKAWVNWASPTLELVFAAACTTDDPELKSVAPQDTVLEDFKSRFHWIGKAAKKFHGLMQTQAAYMEGELQAMASWVSMSDPAPKPIPPYMP
ncbi:hypothetical protein EXZ61_11135 [Rhodoferax aquaticus]|uniref:Uncharacterized protein n=1 Tax=Rhodoferax aquaticus TaxID=2527691 RepID=A0A515EVR6_9BURK|nr:hypothetical protein EXZ61_11135 [Rhodoferax aquaticus]